MKIPDHNSPSTKLAELERSIADYQQIEQELRAAKEFSDNLIETANAIVLTLDPEARITRFNQAAERITGYTKREIIGKNWIDTFIPEVVRGTVRRVFREVLHSGGETSSFENPITTKSGEEKIISWSNTIIRGEDGSPTSVLSIGIDVTEQWQAENDLRESETRYRTLFESANDAIFLIEDQKFVDCNERAVEMFGCRSKNDIIGLNPWQFSSLQQSDGQNSEEKARFLMDRAMGGRPQNFTWEHRKMNGELFEAEVSLNSFQVGAETFLMAVARDITQSKRAGNMLRSLVKGTSTATGKRFFRSLVKYLAQGVGVSSALVGELEQSPKREIRSLAAWHDGKHLAGFKYDLEGTPCEEVITRVRSFCYSEVQEQFPDGHVLVNLGIHTYLGTPLTSPGGESLGILALMHDRPIPEDLIPDAQSLLAVFATRAVAELERVRAESELLAAKERIQQESEALSQKNIAMSQILEHIESEREGFREELAIKVENLLLPIVERLRKTDGQLRTGDVDRLEDTLKSILGKEIDVFRRNLARLSGREIQVAELIRNGLSSKEIAEKLGISLETVNKHRESIRRKLQITHASINLSTHLKSKPWPL